MNLIPCSEKCVHQREGYCNCDQAGVITQNAVTQKDGCLYFAPEQQPKKLLPKELKSL